VLLHIPDQWGRWRWATPFPSENAVVAAGTIDGVPWLRTVRADDGTSRLVLDGDAIGGLPVDGAVTADGSRILLLVAEPEISALPAARWRVLEIDALTGAQRDTGIGGGFPAPAASLMADFAPDAGALVLWAEGGGNTALRVGLDGTQTPLEVSTRRSRSPFLRVLPTGAAQLWTDGVVTVLDRSGRPAQELFHEGPVYDVAVSPDGTWAASAGASGVLVLWTVDPATGRWYEPERLDGHVGGVVGAEADPAGRTLVTVAEDGTAISWAIHPAGPPPPLGTDTSALLARACGIVGRDFSPAEWARYLPERPYSTTCTDLS
jgi:hypothetical protein